MNATLQRRSNSSTSRSRIAGARRLCVFAAAAASALALFGLAVPAAHAAADIVTQNTVDLSNVPVIDRDLPELRQR